MSSTSTSPSATCSHTVDSRIAAYGDPDDHLRMTVLLADAIGHELPGEREAVEACKAPSSAWSARLHALNHLLDQGKELRLVIDDIDALYQGSVSPEERWRDHTFKRERAALFDRLLRRISCSQWRLTRPAPRPDVTLLLRDHGVALPPSPQSDNTLLLTLSAEIRPLARWLLDKEVLRPFDLEGVIKVARDEGDSPDEDVLAIVDDILPRRVERCAHQLSLLRPPQPLNGAIGPFGLNGEEAESVEIGQLPRAAIEMLQEAGVLVSSGQGSRSEVYMPRTIRRFFQRRGRHTLPNVEALHQVIDRNYSTCRDSLATALEAHHHSVHSGNLARALATATHYVSDLRELAYRRSRRASSPSDYFDAAAVYDAILDIDDKDAYAWEYLGYNYARGCGLDMNEEWFARIDRAYQKALEYEPDNPLFAGRALGLRAQRGAAIEPEFASGVARFQSFGAVAVGYFAKAALGGLKRGQHQERFSLLVERWGVLLSQSDELRPWLETEEDLDL